MLILTIRTDKPEAEIGLYEGERQLNYEIWQAHRALAESIHLKMKELLETNNKTWQDIQAVIIFKGPGSFTGLRIGMSVANALAASLQVPIVSSLGGQWITDGTARLQAGENEKTALPEYGAAPHITLPKH